LSDAITDVIKFVSFVVIIVGPCLLAHFARRERQSETDPNN